MCKHERLLKLKNAELSWKGMHIVNVSIYLHLSSHYYLWCMYIVLTVCSYALISVTMDVPDYNSYI
jgi:hypothetical protein